MRRTKVRLGDRVAEIAGWRIRKIGGVKMTALQYAILDELAKRKVMGRPWAGIQLHGNAVNALLKHKWIIESTQDNQPRYQITYCGLKALETIGQPRRRSDGLCRRCDGKRPREVQADGKLAAYCAPCRRERSRLARRRHVKRRNAELRARIEAGERILCRCGLGELYVQASGTVTTACRDCIREYRHDYSQRKQRETSSIGADTHESRTR